MTLKEPPALDIDPLIDDPGTRIVVCCGSGGVGKTTSAAALSFCADRSFSCICCAWASSPAIGFSPP